MDPTRPLQTVEHARRVHRHMYLTLSCGHVAQTLRPLTVGDRFQCKAAGCQDVLASLAWDAETLASVIQGQLEMRRRPTGEARRNATTTSELLALAASLTETLEQLASVESAK